MSSAIVCLEKRSGGLGVKNHGGLNKALLAKWRWRFVVERGSLWNRVIRDKYGFWGGRGGRRLEGGGLLSAVASPLWLGMG